MVIDESKLFSKRLSIFSNREGESSSGANIFANSKSVNLFTLGQQKITAINIFSGLEGKDPMVVSEEESEQSGSISNAQEDFTNEPKEKVMKFNYEQLTERLGEFRLRRFKCGGAATK